MWVTHGGNIAYVPHDVELVVAECEGPDDYNGILAAIETMPVWLNEIPKAIITNFSTPLGTAEGYNPEAAAPLLDAGFACLTEAYLGDNPNGTPKNLDFVAKQLGWDYSVPTFGVYNKPLSEYEEWADWPYGTAVYLAENVL